MFHMEHFCKAAAMVVAAALPLWAGTKNGTGSFSQAASSTSPKSILMPGECFVAIHVYEVGARRLYLDVDIKSGRLEQAIDVL